MQHACERGRPRTGRPQRRIPHTGPTSARYVAAGPGRELYARPLPGWGPPSRFSSVPREARWSVVLERLFCAARTAWPIGSRDVPIRRSIASGSRRGSRCVIRPDLCTAAVLVRSRKMPHILWTKSSGAGWSGGVGSYPLVQPLLQRRRGTQEAHDAVLRPGRIQPWRSRPLPPADQALAA